MYVTEYDVENKFIEVIQRNWYKYSSISNYDELLENFRAKLNELNADKLNGEELTNEEFRTIVHFIESKSIFEASQILRAGKIDVIKRNNIPIYLKLIDFDNICHNSFQVAHQIKTMGEYLGRFDVTLLINGIPFVQIELKKPGVEINRAFNQVLRYKHDGNYKGIFNCIQLFVISNEQHTKYFANNDMDIHKSNCFVWRDVEGELVNHLYDFEESFLFCPQLFEIVFKYMVDSSAKKRLYVMRPYQIYALKALTERCLKDEKNGYCFHSTGSGKTLTSFKFAKSISKEPSIEKVFFLVDRRDLDDKTIDDFSSYSSSSVEEFTNIKTTNELIKRINSNEKLIVATINKFANALKGKNANKLDSIKDKRVVFMFDECHRSQAGEMRRLIDKNFTNALFYGFTGTPIFNEEDEFYEKSQLTSNFFGTPVHTYTMLNAIGDKNVLPLVIDYVGSFKTKEGVLTQPDKEVEGIDYQEVLLSDERISIVAQNVLDTYKNKTVNGTYNAIFACQSIHLLLKYYRELINNPLGLKIAAIYSYDPNEEQHEGDDSEIAKDELAKIIDEYNKRPENLSHYSISTYEAYERDVIKNFRNRQLDILLVVDKCLTGMDFVQCNTLYLDKSMRMHGLIQAISRTIRTDKESKICGNIVCYQTSKKTMEEALAHFNNDVDVYREVTLPPVEELIKQLNECYADCESKRNLADSPSDDEKRTYVESFRALMRVYNQALNYAEFDINNTDMPLTEYYELQGLYKDIYTDLRPHKVVESVLNDIDFEIDLLDRVNVNFTYLMELLADYRKQSESKEKQDSTKTKILKVVDDVPVKSKKELLLKFVYSFMDQDIENLYNGNNVDPFARYRDFITEEKDKDITEMSTKYQVDKVELTAAIEDYAFYQDDHELSRKITSLFQNIDMDFSERNKKIDELREDVIEFFDKYDDMTQN